jgi:hypothetical protein
MKKFILVLSVLLSSVAAADDVDRSPYYTAITSISTEVASYTFMMEQFLQVKCGKKQPLHHIEKASESHVEVLIELKAGNYESAQKLINNIQCK